jgi:hypothetical protein
LQTLEINCKRQGQKWQEIFCFVSSGRSYLPIDTTLLNSLKRTIGIGDLLVGKILTFTVLCIPIENLNVE